MSLKLWLKILTWGLLRFALICLRHCPGRTRLTQLTRIFLKLQVPGGFLPSFPPGQRPASEIITNPTIPSPTKLFWRRQYKEEVSIRNYVTHAMWKWIYRFIIQSRNFSPRSRPNVSILSNGGRKSTKQWINSSGQHTIQLFLHVLQVCFLDAAGNENWQRIGSTRSTRSNVSSVSSSVSTLQCSADPVEVIRYFMPGTDEK